MAPPIEISIPTTTISNTPSPYTIYNVTIRLSLRSFTVQKRYSDFVNFHASLTNQVASPPPAPLPPKSWFSKTTNNPTFLEERRKGLERYLCAINESEDSRWRNSSAWRTFLNLPPTSLNHASSRASSLHAAFTGPGSLGGDGNQASPITDPTTWLDCHRDVKSQLHDARLHLTRRDQAATPQKQHECSAQAKSCLVRAGTMLGALEDGLKNLQDSNRTGWGSGTRLGDGELRRRKDLLASARKEKDGLENLLNAMTVKSKLDAAVASIQDRQKLIGSGPAEKPKLGRVLGKETEQTRELDNEGVLQLQKQIMENQDMSVEELRKIIARQRELGVAINEELHLQNELLNLVDEDAERVRRKVEIAKKRTANIS
ncbi:hypothetical protein VTO42DRAFT_1008 [Malbranchea cinnamomea]